MFLNKDINICIIGLGYVGLPLAVEFGKKFKTLGFDLNKIRIEELLQGKDQTLEVLQEELERSKSLTLTSKEEDISSCNVFIVTVPTPIDSDKNPDLTPIKNATKTISKYLKSGDIVIYESTVYPGVTEEICVPILEKYSSLKYNKDFYAGYSPERINPGDKNHKLTQILKVTSGSTPEIAIFIDNLYGQIIEAGTYLAESIRVAEAAKVIENTQRDLNIALVNELSIIFNKIGIDTEEVLKAAETKWNFLPFRPGLVGGHCIGVDPYYLTHKAKSLGYSPDVILSGRRINDSMGSYIANNLKDSLSAKGVKIEGSEILILGFSFKENCPDIRNTKVVDLTEELLSFGASVDIHDPWVNKEEVMEEYGYALLSNINSSYDAVILAVAHDEYKSMSIEEIKELQKEISVVYDLKYVLPKEQSDIRL